MRNKSRLLAIAAAVLLVAAVAGGTLAWLSDQTPAVVNTFAVPENTPEVKEEFDGSVKSSVTIQNTGNITSYVRVKLVGNWVDGSDNVIPEPEDSTLTGWPVTVADGWFEKDGWYYYETPVDVNGLTGELLGEQVEATVPKDSGITFQLNVIAETIQAEGVTDDDIPAVTAAWGVTVNSDKTISA